MTRPHPVTADVIQTVFCGQLVPCTQDHVHNEICAFYGDAPIHTPVRRDPTKGRPTT